MVAWVYRPFWCKFSPCSELIKNKCYTHYCLYRLHPLVGKSYCRPIAVTQIRADLRCKQSSATAKNAVDRLTLVKATRWMAAFCFSTALLASQVCSNLCYSDWATVALSHLGVYKRVTSIFYRLWTRWELALKRSIERRGHAMLRQLHFYCY